MQMASKSATAVSLLSLWQREKFRGILPHGKCHRPILIVGTENNDAWPAMRRTVRYVIFQQSKNDPSMKVFLPKHLK
jgi:hypothetical protein